MFNEVFFENFRKLMFLNNVCGVVKVVHLAIRTLFVHGEGHFLSGTYSLYLGLNISILW